MLVVHRWRWAVGHAGRGGHTLRREGAHVVLILMSHVPDVVSHIPGVVSQHVAGVPCGLRWSLAAALPHVSPTVVHL